jgi:hypothetical protein
MRRRNKGPLDNIIEAVGGVNQLAELLGVSRISIQTWQDRDPDAIGKLKVNILCRALKIEEIYKVEDDKR